MILGSNAFLVGTLTKAGSNNMLEDYLWVEKYRPKTIDECILPDELKKTFQQFVDQKNIPNLLLSGGAGVG